MVSQHPIHDLDIGWQKELRFLGWKLWSLQNILLINIFLLLLPTILLIISAYWKFGFLAFSLLKLVFIFALLLDLIAIALFGISIVFSKAISDLNRLDKRFLGIIISWLFLTSILRIMLIGSIMLSPRTEMSFLEVYNLITELWFLLFWAMSNFILLLILIADTYINPLKVRKGLLEDHRSLFGLFCSFPVVIIVFGIFLERYFDFSIFYTEFGSSIPYIFIALVGSKFIIGPIIGRRAGRLEMNQIIVSNFTPDIDKRKKPIVVNMKKTRYLKYTKKMRNVVLVTVIVFIILPISPFFLTKMYKEPDVFVSINRTYPDNEALGVLQYIEALPLKNLVDINSENLMTNNTLRSRLDLISESTDIDIFYLFTSSHFYFSLYWDVSIEKLNNQLLDTSILESYWSTEDWSENSIFEAYVVYWIDEIKYHDLSSFNSSEIFAEWFYMGNSRWNARNWSFFGGSGAIYVDQMLFLNKNLTPICFVFKEYSYYYS